MTSRVVERKQCPKCAAEGRDTSEDNLVVYDDGHTYCYACSDYHSSTMVDDAVYTFEYLPWRGITADTFKFYDVKTKINAIGKPVMIGFKHANGSIQVRSLYEKEFFWSKQAPSPVAGLWGRDKFSYGSHKYVTITEGAIDACSIFQVLGQYGPSAVVSVRSSSTALRDCTADREWLRSYERVYLALDDDAAGRDAAKSVARLLGHGKVYDVRFSPRKDANEYLEIPGGPEALRNLWKNARVYVPENILSGFDTFKKLLEGKPKQGIPYPFKGLTDMTYGLRTGEAVLIKAPEKVGKTSLLRAIVYQLLKETNDNVGTFFLEELPQRHLQSLAGLQLGKPCHLPDVDCSNDEINSAIQSLLQRDDRLFVYSAFGGAGGDQLLADIRYLVAGLGCRWIALDPINIAVSAASRETDERRELEYITTRLEIMLKELDFGLIFTSHVNDQGQTRGSHYITKVADITIDISRDTLSVDPLTRRTMLLSIPYNRYCYSTGPAGKLIFDPITYTYTEIYDGRHSHSKVA